MDSVWPRTQGLLRLARRRGRCPWSIKIIFIDFIRLPIGGAYEAYPYTNCSCGYVSARDLYSTTATLYADLVSLGSCEFYLTWDFTGYGQYFGSCSSGACRSSGSVEMLVDGENYGSYSTYDSP
jgi:hypothetical protein